MGIPRFLRVRSRPRTGGWRSGPRLRRRGRRRHHVVPSGHLAVTVAAGKRYPGQHNRKPHDGCRPPSPVVWSRGGPEVAPHGPLPGGLHVHQRHPRGPSLRGPDDPHGPALRRAGRHHRRRRARRPRGVARAAAPGPRGRDRLPLRRARPRARRPGPGRPARPAQGRPPLPRRPRGRLPGLRLADHHRRGEAALPRPRLGRPPAARLQELHARVGPTSRDLEQRLHRPPSQEELAHALEVEPAELERALEAASASPRCPSTTAPATTPPASSSSSRPRTTASATSRTGWRCAPRSAR